MKCNDIKRWIHLNKPGELSKREKTMLEGHLRQCPSCKELVQEIDASGLYIQQLRKIEPVLTYPETVSADIMRAIQYNDKKRYRLIPSTGIFDFFFSYKVKALAFVVVISLIALFGYQQFFIINKLNSMEQKIALNPSESKELPNRYQGFNDKLVKELVLLNENEQIVLNKESLDHFLEKYMDLKTNHDELIELLNKNLGNIEKKLSKKDFQKIKELLTENELEKILSTNL